MRETLKDWKRDWREENGETHDLEVVISDSKLDEYAPYVYEGNFANIPKELLDRRVIKYWQIIESSNPERNGAYSLKIWGNNMEENYKKKLYKLLERAEKEKDSETITALRWAIFDLENR